MTSITLPSSFSCCHLHYSNNDPSFWLYFDQLMLQKCEKEKEKLPRCCLSSVLLGSFFVRDSLNHDPQNEFNAKTKSINQMEATTLKDTTLVTVIQLFVQSDQSKRNVHPAELSHTVSTQQHDCVPPTGHR